MNHLRNVLPAGLAVITLVAGSILLAVVPTASSAAGNTPVLFGMDSASMAAQSGAGVKADYGTFWIGPWTLTSGWGGPDGQLTSMRNAGVTPAIHFYYWGDDITPTCVENGCWSSLHNAQKTRAGWQQLGTQMTDHLTAKMGGQSVVVFLESEFNKGGISSYDPFDGYMAEMADAIHSGYPNAIVVLGFGNWDSAKWGNFDRAAAASDMVGLQGMRGSTKDSPASYDALYDATLAGVRTLGTLFPAKPIMLTDIALSSYPESTYTQKQADNLAKFFTGMPALKQAGVTAMIYRSWLDSPNMDLANYYGQAERHWGLSTATQTKPSAQVWIDGVKAERAGAATSTPIPPPAPVPAAIPMGTGVTTQIETFATRQAGGQQSDPAAQGGTMWNLWSNGAVSQSYNFTGDADLSVRARGTPADGVAPHMDVYIAGNKVLAVDPQSTYADHRVRVNGNGTTEVRIVFNNDAKTATEDRNLILDAVSLMPANRAPSARFDVISTNLTVVVDGSGSSDPDGGAISYAWTFGDGASGTGATASHAYAAAGAYIVTLAVSDGDLSSTASQQVTAIQPNRAPVASFAAAASQLTITVDASNSTDADGDALTQSWSFGDGTAGTGRTASHVYAAGGTYTVTLTVSDGQATSAASRAVTLVQPFAATFTTKSASNEYWVQEAVASTPATVKVEMKVNGGAWQALKHESYGDWTLAKNIVKGTPVVFRATSADGQTVTSATQLWLGAASTTTSTTAPAFKATFAVKSQTNNWWIESAVNANQPIMKVEAKVNSGGWITLPATEWGTYAKSISAPDGARVVLRATASSGATSSSGPYTWG